MILKCGMFRYNNIKRMGKEKYDFILFENVYAFENHYKDVLVFATMLKKAGFRVAIADVFKENRLCSSTDIPHIKMAIRPIKTFSKQNTVKKGIGFLKYTIYRFLQNVYLIYVLLSLYKKTKNFYVGSLTIITPILWMLFFIGNKHYFIWGLRSATLQTGKRNRFSRYGLYSIMMNKLIRHNKRIRIVVSNEIIKREFIERVGVAQSKILVRPERWITNEDVLLPVAQSEYHELQLLTMGSLRKKKHVEYVYEALRSIEDLRVVYTVAGRCLNDNGYEEMLDRYSKGLNNVVRINKYIEETLYNELFRKCDFFVLVDEPDESCGSNGTMVEALIKGCPVIAPDHEPFVTEINKYKVGLIYKLGDASSLASTIEEAALLGKNSFVDAIENYRKMLSETNVIASIKEQMDNCLY